MKFKGIRLNLFPLAAVCWLLSFYFLIFGPHMALYFTLTICFIERLFIQAGLWLMSRASMAMLKQLQQGGIGEKGSR